MGSGVAIFHLHVKNISRGEGRSVVAAAAYRAGETLPNEAEERESAFGGRRDVLHAEIRAPLAALVWMTDRARLWNAVEASEIRKDARLAKEIEVALPRELPRAEWLNLVRAFADAYVAEGFVVDFAIHDDGTADNPHAHLLLTTRILIPTGFGPKIREADGKKFVLDARKLWAKITNTTFAKGGSSLTIDHRSHAEAGLDQLPGRHRGPDTSARRLRRASMSTDRIADARAELFSEALNVTSSPAPVGDDALDSHQARFEGGSPVATIEHQRDQEYVEMQADLKDLHRPMTDDELPVPDPDGNLITQQERDKAEDAMIEAMHQRSDRRDEWFHKAHNNPERAPVGAKDVPASSQSHWFARRQRPVLTEREEDIRVPERDRGQH